MLEALTHPVDVVTWRWLLQVVLLSLGLTLACALAFRRDALSRRSLGVIAVWALVLVPVMLLIYKPRYQIGLIDPPSLPALAGVPLVMLLLWLAVAFASCAALVAQLIRTTRALGSAPPVLNGSVTVLCEELSARLATKVPRLITGERCCASSVGRPTLVVPDNFIEWPEDAQRSVVAHELVHLQRQDDRAMIGLQFVLRCYPFCPWLVALYQRFVTALEEACDERAAELVGCRATYLEGLAEAALREGGRDYRDHTAMVATLIDAKHKSAFMRRLARLLGKQQFFEVQSGALAAGLGLGLLVLGASTTFEIVAVEGVDRRLSAGIVLPRPSSRSRVSLPLPATHEVRVIPRFPAGMPRRVEQTTPAIIYPGRALNDHVEGEVLVEYGIANDGSTAAVRVIESSHPRYFDSAAIRAVQQTVYAPRHNVGFSGVTAARHKGSLLAVRNSRRNHATANRPKAQKLFLFRLHEQNAMKNASHEAQRN